MNDLTGVNILEVRNHGAVYDDSSRTNFRVNLGNNPAGRTHTQIVQGTMELAGPTTGATGAGDHKNFSIVGLAFMDMTFLQNLSGETS